MRSARLSTYYTIILLFVSITIQAQQQAPLDMAMSFLVEKSPEWGLHPKDLSDLIVTDQYISTHNQITHIYFKQRLNGIPIFNAITGVHLDSGGNIHYMQNRFWSNLERRVNSTQTTISPVTALQKTAEHLNLDMDKIPVLPRSNTPNEIHLDYPKLSRSTIPITLLYTPMPDSTLQLAWQVGIHDPRSTDYWVTFIDAASGNIIGQMNRTIYCHFGADEAQHSQECQSISQNTPPDHVELNPLYTPVQDQAVYNVFPFPMESPIHGNRTMVINPADPIASPYGWHDINGIKGAEFQNTQGNNTFTYLDRDADDASDGNLPDGGAELIFDFPFSPTVEPEDQADAALTQLFYTTNYMHDFAYHYGFNEAAGNFQTNNYGRGGKEKDGVLAQAHDGSGINNANFLTLPDGDPGAMQMYFWTPSNAAFLQVTAPANIAGSVIVGTAAFGPLITSKATYGQVVEIIDSIGANLACTTILNKSELAGKIALITRGTCTFKAKVLEAQKAGAIGVIIANGEDQTLTMGNDNTAATPRIPSVLIKSSDATRIRNQLKLKQQVFVSIAYQGEGPALRDGSFDNGVVAHEYAHGISNRLTGGPSNADCVFNDEAMGEGWSDFFTLITTVKPGQTGQEPRGIGNYSVRNTVNGPGIRRKPYSTDFTINNQVYKDIIGTRPANATTRIPHPVGEIWAATLWDLYWAMSAKYGWNPDPIRGNGGNNKAIQLVMDGLKLQPCSPGFTDGRDAILLADQINNNGANQCLIWEVFARRGLGWSADQGSVNDRNDGIQAFDLPPTCLNSLLLKKQSTPNIQPGQPIQVELTLTNHKKTPSTGIIVRDLIPLNTQFIPESVQGSQQVSQTKDTLILFIGDLAPGGTATIRYTLQSNGMHMSTRYFFDDMERGSDHWVSQNLKGEEGWELTTASASTGRLCWAVPCTSEENHQVLQLKEPILVKGKQPVLRFFHKYHTQTTYDGGLVEFSVDNGTTWIAIPDTLLFRKPYTRPLVNNTFGIAKFNGFSGQSTVTFQASYINLQPYIGKNLLFRFSFASNEDEAGRTSTTLPGWFVDNVELLDIFNYATTACAQSKNGDTACANTFSWGTIVEPALSTGIDDLDTPAALEVFPNPAQDVLFIRGNLPNTSNMILELLTPDGHVVKSQQNALSKSEYYEMYVSELPSGIYFLRIRSAGSNLIHKVVITR